MNLAAVLNPYERKARLYPALLAMLPVALTAALAFHDVLTILQSLVGLVVAAGGAFLCAELARDGGKKIEPELMNRWGGFRRLLSFGIAIRALIPITRLDITSDLLA